MDFSDWRKPNDCPQCGKKESATMLAASWQHGIKCCSDECGNAISEKIEANCATEQYRNAAAALRKAHSVARELKYSGIGVDYDPSEESEAIRRTREDLAPA